MAESSTASIDRHLAAEIRSALEQRFWRPVEDGSTGRRGAARRGGAAADLPGARPGDVRSARAHPIRRAAISTPLLRLPAEPLSFAFNVIRFPATAERTRTHRLVRANAAIYDRVRRAGGTLYPASALPVSHAQWRGHFGPAYEELRAAKWRYDPEGVLTPGYTLFA